MTMQLTFLEVILLTGWFLTTGALVFTVIMLHIRLTQLLDWAHYVQPSSTVRGPVSNPEPLKTSSQK